MADNFTCESCLNSQSAKPNPDCDCQEIKKLLACLRLLKNYEDTNWRGLVLLRIIEFGVPLGLI